MEAKNFISAKHLGDVNGECFCPRCFWLKMHLSWKLPYQSFPGIFSTIDSYTKNINELYYKTHRGIFGKIDSYTKNITDLYYKRHQGIPPWLRPLKLVAPIDTPRLKDFHILHEPTGLVLRGIPDEVYKRFNGSYAILDNKTASITDNSDDLLPIYETQLNAYAYIAERVGLKPVTNLSLIYYDPSDEITSADIDKLANCKGFAMNFRAQIYNVPINPKLVEDSLERVKSIIELKKPPKALDKCINCKKTEDLIALLNQ